MKTRKVIRIIILTLVIGSLSILSTYASGPAAVTAKNIREKIVNQIFNKDDMENLPSEGIVVVLFTVSDDGKIEIKKVESTNDEAGNFVTKKISSISAEDNVYPYHQVYRVKFQFDQN